MKTHQLFTFAALLLLAGASVRASPGADELALTRQRTLAGLLGGGRNCRAFCEGKPIEGDGHNSECWGLFKVWCGPPTAAPGEEPKRELSGLICQGHWKAWALPAPVAGSAAAGAPALVTLCEGGHKWFASRTSTCPHSGHVHKKMMGLLSAGEIVNIMGVSGPEAAVLQAQAQRTTQEQQQEGLRRYQQVAEELTRLGAPRAAAFASHDPSVSDSGARVFSLESRHHGFKVEARATRRLPPSSSPVAEETFESLADQLDELLAPTWRDWLPAAPPPERRGNGSFELLCNGQPAWLHGAVPCWGNFTVAGTRTWSRSSPAASAEDAKKPCSGKMTMGGKGDVMHHGHSSRRLMSTTSTPLKTMERGLPLSHATAQQQGQGQGATDLPARAGMHEGEATHTEWMKAECDGLWSGVLGHTCMGVSTSHVEITVEKDDDDESADGAAAATLAKASAAAADDDDDDDDDEPAMSKWSICSGHQTVRFVHRDYTYGMVVECKGGSVTSLNVTMEEP